MHRNRRRLGRIFAVSGAAAVAAVAVLAMSGASALPNPPPSFTPNHLFVGGYDGTNNGPTVFEFEPDGDFVRKIPLPNAVAPNLNSVTSLAFGPDGALYCAVVNSDAVLRVSPALAVTTVIDAADGVSHPSCVAFGPQGRLYVGTQIGGGVPLLVADLDGTTIADRYALPEADQRPEHVTFGPDGHLFLSVGVNGDSVLTSEIQELDADLRVVRTFGAAAFSGLPGDVTIGPGGTLLVADDLGDIRRFDPDGAPLADLPPGGLSQAVNTAFGPDGRLYVVNPKGNTVTSHDPVSGAISLTYSQADLVNPRGIAFAPFRFKVKLQGTLVGKTVAALAEPTSVMSLSPGSGTVMVSLKATKSPNDVVSRFPNHDALVFHGLEVVSPDGDSFLVQAMTVTRHENARAIGSIGVAASRTTAAGDLFVPKSLAGTLHLARPGTTLSATFRTSRRAP